MNTRRVLQALKLAIDAHGSQLDRQGKPYIFHPIRVGMAGKTEDEMIVGFLHDTLEDTPLHASFIEAKFGIDVMKAVFALTRREGQDYVIHIGLHVSDNDLATRVKLNDLADNLSPERMGTMSKAFQDSHIKKYQAAQAFLKEKLEEKGEPPTGLV